MTKFLAIGRLTKPFGLKGGIKVLSFSGEFDHFFKLKGQQVQLHRGQDVLQLAVESVQMKGDAIVMIFHGYATPESVADIRGYELWVARDMAAPLEDGEFYLSDIIGSALIYQGQCMGTISGYFEAADIILEIQRPQDKPLYIPFTAIFIGDVDLENKTVELLDDRLL